MMFASTVRGERISRCISVKIEFHRLGRLVIQTVVVLLLVVEEEVA